jgi:uncharacterized protein YggE
MSGGEMKFTSIMLISLFVLTAPLRAEADTASRTITVTGKAEIMVVPDEAVINMGVETFQRELEDAKRENDRSVSAIISVVKDAGVSTDHIKTDYLNIQPRYRETAEERVLLGYVVRQSINIDVKDLDKLEDIISAALGVGANQIQGLEFRASDLKEHKDEARAKALEASKKKAEAMAGRLGEKIGRPLSIIEEPAGTIFPKASNFMRFGGASGEGAAGALAAGRISISARVSVTFELID